jgi:hypothetical protein
VPSRPGSRQIDLEGFCDGFECPGSLRECLRQAAVIRLRRQSAISFYRGSKATADNSVEVGEFPPERVGLRHSSQPGIHLLDRPAMF